MKNNDDVRLLAHKRQVDEQRRAKAIMRERARKARAVQAMAMIANPSLRPIKKAVQ